MAYGAECRKSALVWLAEGASSDTAAPGTATDGPLLEKCGVRHCFGDLNFEEGFGTHARPMNKNDVRRARGEAPPRHAALTRSSGFQERFCAFSGSVWHIYPPPSLLPLTVLRRGSLGSFSSVCDGGGTPGKSEVCSGRREMKSRSDRCPWIIPQSCRNRSSLLPAIPRNPHRPVKTV